MHKLTKITFKFIDLLIIFMMTFGSPMSALAQVWTVPTDASPGSTVMIYGDNNDDDPSTNFLGGEAVHVDVVGPNGGYFLACDALADENGAWACEVTLSSDPALAVGEYTFTATGLTSGNVETGTFTDAQQPSANLDQCRNGSATAPNDCKDLGGSTGWVNGNVGDSQAHMLEGYSTPFREVMENLPLNTTITLVIGYDIKHDGHTYDYLTSYQRLEPHAFFGHPAEAVLPLDGVTGVSASVDTFPIPAPSSAGSPVGGQPTASFNSLPAGERVMTLFGGDITNVYYVSEGSLTDNISQTQIAIEFKVDSATAVLAWGGHIAQCSVWGLDAQGKCRSAGGISGSPYHMANISWNLNNLGNTDRSMKANVVVQPGNLILAKSLTGGPNGYTGPFTINYDCGPGFVGSVTINAGSSQTIPGIPASSVCTISETPPTPPAGYTFGTPTFTPSNVVTIGEGTTVTVTTNNTLTQDQGYLKITKSFDPKISGFNGTFAIVYNCGAGDITVNLAAGGSITVGPFATGTSCTVSEPTLPTAPTGWTFGTPSVSGSPATIVKGNQAAAVEVTVTNSISRDQGYLKIAKNFDAKTSGFSGTFAIVYNCGAGDVTVNLSANTSTTVGPFDTGTVCTVSEPTLPSAPTGWTFGTPSVSGSPATIVKGNQAAAVEVTVTNSITRDQGYFKVEKVFDAKGSGFTGKFDIVYDCGAGNVTVQLGAGESQTFGPFPTGTSCTVSEPTLPTPPADWIFGSPSISGSPVIIVKGDAASAQVVTVTNSITHLEASISVTKSPSVSDVCNGSGSTVTYTYVVTNTGDVALTGTLVDDNGTSGITGDDVTVGNFTNLAPAASQTFTHDFTVNGTTTNTVTATGTSAGGQTATDTASSTVAGHNCTISITKTPSTANVCNGSHTQVTYTYVVTNNSDFYSVSGTVSDDQLGSIGSYGPLAPHATATLTKVATVNGTVTNTATATGTFDDTSSTSDSDTATATVTGHRCSISITKTPSTANVCSGSYTQVTYTYVVTNNSDFYSVSGSVSDNQLGAIGSYGPLAPGTSATLTKVATVNGTVTNTATATGTFGDTKHTTATDTATATVTGHTCTISITKTPSTANVCNGSNTQVTYTYVVTNTGDFFNASGTVKDDNGTPGNAADDVNVGSFGPLAPGGTATLTKAFTVNGTVTNTATATGTFSDVKGTTATASASATVNGHNCTISITKMPSVNQVCNSTNTSVTYTYVVTNNSDLYSVSGTVTDNQLGSIGNFGPLAPGATATFTKAAAITATTTNTATANGTFNDGTNKSATATASATVTGVPCQIIIKKIIKPTGSQTSFSFDANGTGYVDFSLSDQQTNTQNLLPGTYTVKELVPLGWVLTGIGGAAEPYPFNCTVSGTGGSSGTGNLDTQTATITLQMGDIVTCVFENTGVGATRTQGFWATHPQLAQIAWFGGTAFGHTFPGVAGVTGIGDRIICGRAIEGPGLNDISKLMGGFWSDISKTSTGKKRSALDQARMQLLQQLLAAELNASAFGSVPTGGTAKFAQWESALCSTDQGAISTAQGQAASFNSAGDSATFTPGTSAQSKYARSIANIPFWDIIKP